ncbi:CRISPR-associated endonuclease Cas1 [Mesosutterella sp. OilRF-GAM-744-9]|uniref:CRISPR-associated endonuclease Cas1 n=1 Tax=Mesosutterella porci TaxID=2915351 RepID=A0ABS9MPA1_9BURK|nr:CRISPR-associated endonuclease Cas1 [Mesosutterella sp. oilRF-744-WT-GAM-9]MCG5030447.1 CRISPR-associated endonuclease Cas1 [Mesosutterella sp. oilRF-744-WT-GAM-9]
MEFEFGLPVQKLNEIQHSDFIWTWKSNKRSSRMSLWLPYYGKAEKIPRSKHWKISYNGGILEVDLSSIDFIMLYGATGDLPVAFLDELSQHRITLIIHRRNQPFPYVFQPVPSSDDADVLTKQILFRENQIKRVYIAKTLIKARLSQMAGMLAISPTVLSELAKSKKIEDVRAIEAHQTARYWKQYFTGLKLDVSRREQSPIASALDAGSKFLYGIMLRWILFHKMSPCHAYLHEPSSYPTLAYDLMEPYRYIFEEAVAAAAASGIGDSKKLVAKSLSILKDNLEVIVYVPATRQYVRRKNLLHGAVLALRAYLLGEVPRLVLPQEGKRKGGRPPKTGYRLPGETKPGKENGGI